jgi:Ca-activated chloride channel family protein
MNGLDRLSWGEAGIPMAAIGLLVLLFGAIAWLMWREGRRAALRRAGPFGAALDVATLGRDVLRAGLVLVAATLLVVGLKKPRWGASSETVKALGIDVAVALDASKSMKLNDIVPDRLDAARFEIGRLLDGLRGGRAALVPFAGTAFVQTPLTSDMAVVKAYLDSLRVEDMPRGGTAIGRAIATALEALTGEPPEALAERDDEAARRRDAQRAANDEAGGPEADVRTLEGAKHKAIILFTDGEDHEGDALKAAAEAARLGVRIYAIGVGTPQGRPVVQIDAEGKVTGTVKGPDGTTPLFSALNVPLLRDLAEKTGGAYFPLGPDGFGPGLAQALADLERREYEETFQNLGAERYAWVVWPALLLLALELWLGGRRRASGAVAR